MTGIPLKVAEAFQNDIGRGIVRIDSKAKNSTAVSTGDIVLLRGKKAALAIVWQAHPDDEGLDMIRMDGILRQNAGVGLGDKVFIEPAEVKEAKKIVLAPKEPMRYSMGFDQYVKKRLVGKPVLKGNLLPVGIFGTSIPLIVSQVFPQGPIIITEETEVRIKSEPVKDLTSIPNVTYDDVGGLRQVMLKVREMVELPLRHPEIFERLGIDPPKGILLYGPPGTGKTLLAKAVANESDANFYYIGGPEVVSKYVGESEERLRKLFREAEENSPSILFIDELDSIAPKREEVFGEVEKRLVSQMLCVSPDTPIHTLEGSVTIKDLYDKYRVNPEISDNVEFIKPNDLYVYGMDNKGKIAQIKVHMMNKLFVHDAFAVKLDNGAELKTSAIQRFCTIENGKLSWVPITKLAPGDYVAAPSRLPLAVINNDLHTLEKLPEDRYSVMVDGELLKIFGCKYVSLKRLRHFLTNGEILEDGTLKTKILMSLRNNPEITVEKLFEHIGVKGNQKINCRRLLCDLEKTGSIIRVMQNRRKIRALRLGNIVSENYNYLNDVKGLSVFKYSRSFVKPNYYFKLVNTLTPELAELLGYLMADGCLSKQRFNVTGKPALVERAAKIVFDLFGFRGKITKLNEKCWRFDAACQTLPYLFSDIFGLPIGKKAFIIKTPAQLFVAPEECVSSFVAAYADCDGSVESNVRIFSRSKAMMEGMAILLLKLGFNSSLSLSNGMYYCNILGGNKANMRYYREIGTKRKERQEYFEKLESERNVGSSIDFVPNMAQAINTMRSSMHLHDNDYRYLNNPGGKYRLTKQKVAYFVDIYEGEKTELFQNIKSIIESDLVWTRIESITKIEPMEMYDLTTETENFVAGNNPVLLHNTLLDGLKSRGEVIVIGATNRPDALDPALRRPGRFDREIEIGVPDRDGRKEILQIKVRTMPLNNDVDLDELASITHGYTGADISFLTKEAALKSLRRILPDVNLEEEFIPPEILDKISITRNDFFDALREIQPSALREVYVERPTTKWGDIGGLEQVKQEIQEAVELPLKKPELFEKMGIRPIKGLLLYGPPGTGKTLLAKAAANETEANFIAISGAQVLSKWVGDSEKSVRDIFKKARTAAPCVLFIDEIDAIAPMRGGNEGHRVTERVVDTLLTEMDGMKNLKHVVIIGATNRPDILDPALLRAGRFDRVIEVGLPDELTRLNILKIHTKKMPIEKDVDLRDLAKITESYTGADLENLCREAGMSAIREAAKKVGSQHFTFALKNILPTIRKDDIESVEKFKATVANMYR